ncbi:hypothetical protein ACP275_05G038100 [Erythranthe tilingii]
MGTPIRVVADGDLAPYHLLKDSGDDSRLNQLGYKQELSRSLSYVSRFLLLIFKLIFFFLDLWYFCVINEGFVIFSSNSYSNL